MESKEQAIIEDLTSQDEVKVYSALQHLSSIASGGKSLSPFVDYILVGSISPLPL